jgi:hypothetical protein
VALKLEPDSDYHLVIADGDRTMIVEISLPSCGSPALPRAIWPSPRGSHRTVWSRSRRCSPPQSAGQ